MALADPTEEQPLGGLKPTIAAIKQFCGIERAQHRSATAQRNHIGFALRAFLRLGSHRLRTGVSWFEAKTAIVREAVRAYPAHPLYTAVATA